MLSQFVAAIVAIAKALPALERLAAAVERQNTDAKHARAYEQIDSAIAAASADSVIRPCADCPLRVCVAPKPNPGPTQTP